MATYRQAYEAFLTTKMEEGGAPALMEACLADFNAVASPDYRPGDVYKAWFYGALHDCSTCGKSFKFTIVEQPEVDKETTCHPCLSRSTTQGHGERAEDAEEERAPEDHGDA